jgi:hypothetical protein
MNVQQKENDTYIRNKSVPRFITIRRFPHTICYKMATKY